MSDPVSTPSLESGVLTLVGSRLTPPPPPEIHEMVEWLRTSVGAVREPPLPGRLHWRI
ncbi:hypothetical protein [Oxynema aestuarii]|uniref:Uncharacterized protein n=1 Tax=Oxynema aestuarii AP17 TaxID=2064643 RepID=A0A6H1U087_9CYAN|nr:hypothetical protein [Oxynema aestuarii]QIZ71817.1 hypothetical protein HCG48_15530 [Oxynema aestuarii AP17]